VVKTSSAQAKFAHADAVDFESEFKRLAQPDEYDAAAKDSQTRKDELPIESDRIAQSRTERKSVAISESERINTEEQVVTRADQNSTGQLDTEELSFARCGHRNGPDRKSEPKQQASLGTMSLDSKPKYGIEGLSNPAPRYPIKSRSIGEQGKVNLRVAVNQKGHADEVTVFESSGYSRLDRAAVKAVRKWRFQPAQKDGRSARGIVQVPISFVLENS